MRNDLPPGSFTAWANEMWFAEQPEDESEIDPTPDDYDIREEFVQ